MSHYSELLKDFSFLKTKFQKGDMVYFTNKEDWLPFGATGIVKEVFVGKDFISYSVKFNDAIHQSTVECYEDNLAFLPVENDVEQETTSDAINPDHYKVGGIETIDYMQAKLTKEEFIGYLKGNILKYTSRLGHKDASKQEAGKIVWYAKKLEEVLDDKTA